MALFITETGLMTKGMDMVKSLFQAEINIQANSKTIYLTGQVNFFLQKAKTFTSETL